MPWKDDSDPGDEASPWGASSDAKPPRKPAQPEAKPPAKRSRSRPKAEETGPWTETPPRLPRRTATRPAPRAHKPEPLKDAAHQAPGPSLDELGQQLRALFGRCSREARRRAMRRETVAAVVVLTSLGWALSGVYVVSSDQQAVVTRLGRLVGVFGPGFGYHLPAPFGTVNKVSTSVRSLELGDQAAALAESATGAAATPEARDAILTRDGNLVEPDVTVHWRIADPVSFLFHLSDSETVVRTTAQAALREIVGATPLQDITSTGRSRLQARAGKLMQQALDAYGAGVSIVDVQVRAARPPSEVIPAYRETIAARQDADAAAKQAGDYRERVLGEARSEDAKIIQDAQAYRQQSVLEAQGDASRFTQLLPEYRRAPDLTRERLYLETMQRVLSASHTVVVDTPKGDPVVLPPELFHRGDTPTTEAARAQSPPKAAIASPTPPSAGGNSP